MPDNEKERCLTLVHTKLVGDRGEFTIDSSDNWLRCLRSIHVGNFSVTGNGSALPAVVYLRIATTCMDRYFISVNRKSGGVSQRDQGSRIPLFTAQNGLDAKERCVCESIPPAAPLSLTNTTITFETVDTNGLFQPFNDYTSFVVELTLLQDPNPGQRSGFRIRGPI